MSKFYFLLYVCLSGASATFAQIQQDTTPPVLVCKSVEQNTFYINSICLAPDIYAYDLIDTLYDDQSVGALLKVGIRINCTGTGFPDQTVLTSGYGGVYNHREVEIWASDAAGNVTRCETAFFLTDPNGVCDPGTSVGASTAWQTALPGVLSHFMVWHCNGTVDSFTSWPTKAFSHNPVEAYWSNVGDYCGFSGDSTRVSFTKDGNPLNGVSTADLVEIQKHILGLKPFVNPYQYVAADVNQDGKITVYDVVLIQKLILGVTSEFPKGQSWRLLPRDFPFPMPNPITPVIPNEIIYRRTDVLRSNTFWLVGVKLGDVNFSADPTQ